MPTQVQTVYAIDPASRNVRAVLQVDADGWLDAEIEPMLGQVVRACQATGVAVALAVSIDSAFVVRKGASTTQFEIDEIETAELISPHPLHPDPSQLTEAVVRWCKALARGERGFLAMARLPKRVPELVELLSGTQLTTRDGAAEPIGTFEE